eukprot:4672318-Amphidinium_carterae.1
MQRKESQPRLGGGTSPVASGHHCKLEMYLHCNIEVDVPACFLLGDDVLCGGSANQGKLQYYQVLSAWAMMSYSMSEDALLLLLAQQQYRQGTQGWKDYMTDVDGANLPDSGLDLKGATLYECTQGVLFLKRCKNPSSQRIVRLQRHVGSRVASTGALWQGPAGGVWMECDGSSGDRGWMLVSGP